MPIPVQTAKELVMPLDWRVAFQAYIAFSVLYPHRRDLVLPSGVQIIAQGDKFLLLALKDTKT